MSTYFRRLSRVQALPPPSSILIYYPQPPLLKSAPLTMRRLQSSSSKPHINPSVLVIVIILSVVFICSGILHVLARCLGRRRARAPAGTSSPNNSIRGQLQHLFTLHDAGVEQVFIDTLPVFLYGSIRGLKDSADCAVCLNEFANEDRLRLLPKCKHAFHLDCIDTWLLSNSTCPLCRRSLLPEAEPLSHHSVALPSNGTESTEAGSCAGRLSTDGRGGNQSQRHGSFRSSFRGSFRGSFRFRDSEPAVPPPGPPLQSDREILQSALNLPPIEDQTPPMTPGGPTVSVTQDDGSEKVMRVELGKVNVDSRRMSCDEGTSRMVARSYSMGSYEYILDFSNLELTMQPTPFPGHPQTRCGPSKPTHRSALSDSIPELASAGQTPANEDMFWASRGLDTPQSLSKVREIMTLSPGRLMTPSPGRLAFSPMFFESRQGSNPHFVQETTTSNEEPTLQRVINVDPDSEEDNLEEEQALSRRKGSVDNTARTIFGSEQEVELVEAPLERDAGRTEVVVDSVQERSPSLRLPENLKDGAYYMQRNGLPETSGVEEILRVPQTMKDKVWEVSVDVSLPPSSAEGSSNKSGSSKKLSGLSWLRGRGRRLVYSAASPSSPDRQSTHGK